MEKQVDKIVDKIRKLLAKANGTANEHEAAAFMAKAQVMLTKHQLSMDDVSVAEDAVERSVIVVYQVNGQPWHTLIPGIMAEFYGCKLVIVTERGTKCMVAVGRESSRAALFLMYPYIVDQLRKLAAEYRQQTMFSTKKSMHDVSSSFYFRVSDIIAARKAMKADGTEEAQAAGQALILVDEAGAAVKSLFPDIQNGKQIKLSTTELSDALAERVNLGDQVTGVNNEALQIADQR